MVKILFCFVLKLMDEIVVFIGYKISIVFCRILLSGNVDLYSGLLSIGK